MLFSARRARPVSGKKKGCESFTSSKEGLRTTWVDTFGNDRWVVMMMGFGFMSDEKKSKKQWLYRWVVGSGLLCDARDILGSLAIDEA